MSKLPNVDHIKSRLNRVYPIWKSKLNLFFPYAPYELIKNPIPEMYYLLADAFNLLSRKERQELEERMEDLAAGSDGEGDEDSEDEGEEKECSRCKGSGKEPGSKEAKGDSEESKSKGKDGESKSQSKEESTGSEKEGKSKESKSSASSSEKSAKGGEGKKKECEKCKGTGKEPGKTGGDKGGEKDSKSDASGSGEWLLRKKKGRPEMIKDFASKYKERGQSTHQEAFKDAPSQYMYSGHYYDMYLKGIEPTVDYALSNLFKKRLIDEARPKTTSNLEEGELDPNELIGAYSGRRDVFCQYNKGKSNKIAFVIALDHSGSMNCGTDMMQAHASVNIMAAIDKLKIPNAIISFGDEVRYIRLFEDYSDWNPPRGFTGDERPQEAYHQAVNMLKKRREKRKMLLVLSDGALWPEECKHAHREAKRFRIETYAFTMNYNMSRRRKEQTEKVYDRLVTHGRRESVPLEENLYNYMEELFRNPIY